MSPGPPPDYVDVATRIREFYDKYPDGRLTAVSRPWVEIAGDKVYVVYGAYAYRTPDDPQPGQGWAWEPVPGPTPFTRDSELMNAETAAWGRAIASLGFSTKIASAEEVQARQPQPTANGAKATKAQHGKLHVLIQKLQENAGEKVPAEFEGWDEYVKDYASVRYGVDSRANLTKDQMGDLIDKVEGKAKELKVAL